jgi:SAM-dependent methyltransferase
MAREYDEETMDFWDRFPYAIIEAFVKEIKDISGISVLDVGSGPGRDGLILKQNGLDVTCLDASKEMVRLCEEKGLKSILGDFKELPFTDESFDAVWAYTSLLHVPKNQVSKCLEEIKRVLKDKGIFGLGLIEGDVEIYRESSGMNMPRLFSFYKKDEIENILATNHFEKIFFKEFKVGSKNYLNYICKKM